MYHFIYFKKILAVVILASLFTLVDPIHAEYYEAKEGPINQYIGGTLPVSIGWDNILHWASLNVTWYLNSNGAGDGLSFTQTKNAVQAAFDAWENVSTSSIDFTYGGSTANTWSIDNKNVHFWAERGNPIFEPPWNLDSLAGGITIMTFNSYEEFTDVDIVFNGRNWTWKVDGNDYDIQAVSTHEIGHMIGLAHNDDGGPSLAVMFWLYQGTAGRELRFDDKKGASFLYRGNIIYNVTVYTNVTLDWDFHVASGCALTLAPGATVPLNGRLIDTQGTGQIIRMSNVTVTPDIAVKSGSTIKGFYPTIQTAINNATSGQDVYIGAGTYSGNITMKSNVDIIGAGKTASIISGTVTFTSNSNYSQLHDLKTTGVITLNSSSYIQLVNVYAQSKITLNNSTNTYLSNVTAAGGNDAIDINNSNINIGAGTISGNITIKSNVNMIGAGKTTSIIDGTVIFTSNSNYSQLHDLKTIGAITLNSNSYIQLVNVYAQGKITLNNSSSTYLSNVTAAGGNDAIDVNNSSVIIEDLNATFDKYSGIYAHNSAYPNIYYGQIEGNEYGLYMPGSGTAILEEVGFCEQSNVDIFVPYYGYGAAYAWDCIWSGDPNYYTSGNVTYDPEVGYETCGLGKASLALETPSSSQENIVGIDNSKERDAYLNALSIYRVLKKKLRPDIETGELPEPQKFAAEYTNAIELFKEVITNYPKSTYTITALGAIADCYWTINEPEPLLKYLNNIINNTEYKQLYPYAMNLLIPYYLHLGDYQSALNMSDNILKISPSNGLACEILYNKAVIYQEYLGDLEKAIALFQEMAAQYPDHPTAQLATSKLEELGKAVPTIPDKSDLVEQPIEDLSLSGYPNPFNPTATISFCLPKSDKVTITIYDLMGREVVRLIDGFRDAGQYEIIWDGRDSKGQQISTGLYIIKLSTFQGVKIMEMLMMR